MQVLRNDRTAADPLKPRRGMSPLPEPAARGRLRPLRRGQAGRRPHRCRRAGLRAVPPSRARAPALRDVRQDRSDRGPGPRRARRRLRELLPDAAGPVHRLRPPASVQLRRRRLPGLQDVHPAGRERLRPLRTGPAGGRTVARGPGLRHLLYQRAAPPRRLHGLRSAAAADLAARPRRDHVRGLRRPAAQPRMRAMRRRGQTVRERPLRTLQPARPGLGSAGRRRGRSDPRTHRGRRGHHGGPEPLLGPELAADQRIRGNPRRDHSRPHGTDSPGTGRPPGPAGRGLPAAHADRRRSAPRPGRGPGPRRAMEPCGARRHQRNGRPAARPGLPDLAGPAAPAPQVPGQPRPPHRHQRRPPPDPRRSRLPGLATTPWPHPGFLRSRRRGDLARHRSGRLRHQGLPGLGRRPQALEHPGFGGDSILPRCSRLGDCRLPRYRRMAEPRSDHFSAFVLSNICPAALSSCPPDAGLRPARKPPRGLGISSSGTPVLRRGFPGLVKGDAQRHRLRRRRRP